MALFLATIKKYWKFLLILSVACSTLVTGAAWVSRVDVHVKQGEEKIKEFDSSQIGQARLEEKVDALNEKADFIRDEIKEIKKQNNRILERTK